jgi:citrate lyase subunit beta / citryl-CoA lyase
MNPQDWQSLLFVPAHHEKHMLSAIKHRPDAVILDLEDAVPANMKDAARSVLAKHQALLAKAKIDCIVRINNETAVAKLDIAALNMKATAAIMIPKCVDRRSLDRIKKLKGMSKVPLIALVESPVALPNLTQIAATPGLCAFMFGPEDYAAELGIPTDVADLSVPATLVAAAAIAAKLLPIGIPGSLANFTDIKGFIGKVRHARSLGFRAAAAIHPSQLPAIREGFKPTAAEILRAKEITAASSGKDKGAQKVKGAMVDAPIVAQARHVLKLAGLG